MQMCRRIVGIMLAVMLAAPSAWAQQTHVNDKAALDQAVQQRVSQERADRETLRAFLQNPQVRSVVAKAGLSVEKAESAVSTLQGDELARAATQARQANQDLAGGATVVITTTTIIIILLVVIIIILLAQ
jgi:hypothetical protein